MSSAPQQPAYRERLWPAPWVWLFTVGFAASVGTAYGYAYTPLAGWLVAAITQVLLLVGVVALGWTPIEVWPDRIVAGRAHLPIEFVGDVRALDADQTFAARTRNADGRAFLLLRTWTAPTSVALSVTDPDDPHPYWLLTTRHPDRLAAAVRAARPG